LADRINRWIIIFTASIIQLVSLLLFSFVGSVVWFYPLMILQSLVFGLFAPSSVAVVSDMATPEKIGSVMGVYFTAMGLGQFIGPLVTSFLSTYLIYRQMFLVLTLLPVVGLLATLSWKSQVKHTKKVAPAVAKEQKNLTASFKRIFRSRNLLGLCLSRVIFSLSVGVIGALFSVWTKKDLLFTTAMIALLFAARGVANTTIRIPAGRIVDRIGKKIPLLFAFSLVTLAFLIFSVTDNFLAIFLAMAIHGLAWGLRIIPDTAIMTESVTSRDKGLALAILMSMFGLGSAIGSFTAGAAYSLLPMSTIFQIFAGVLFCGVILIAIIIKD
jgi:MFS family permease